MAHPEFLDMMGAIVTRKTVAQRSAYGELTYTEDRTYRARVSYTNVLTRDMNGEEATSTAQVWLYGLTFLDPTDQLVLPDGSTRLILRVEMPMDETGTVHHVKAFLQ